MTVASTRQQRGAAHTRRVIADSRGLPSAARLTVTAHWPLASSGIFGRPQLIKTHGTSPGGSPGLVFAVCCIPDRAIIG
jgi:hypothetical protein